MATRNGTSKRTKGAASAALARIEAELPKTLRGYVRQVEQRLNRLEKDLEKAGNEARRRSTRILREVSRRIGALEQRGETAWQRLTAPYRREAAEILNRLEAALAPARRATKKKVAKKRATKKTAAKKKVAKKKSAKKKSAKTRAAKQPAKKASKKRGKKKTAKRKR